MTNMLLITFYKLNIISVLEIHRCQFVKLKKLVLLTVPLDKMQMHSPYPNLHTFPVTIKGSYPVVQSLPHFCIVSFEHSNFGSVLWYDVIVVSL